jgi:hypothetical protein
VETLVVMMAWKVALPQCVFALRGNHESEFAARAPVLAYFRGLRAR